MKKVLITGATGQDGSFMAEYLLNNTDNLLILAARRTSQAILSNIKHVLDNSRVRLITLDLMDSEAIRVTIKDEAPDYFINFGAQTFVKDSWNHPQLHMEVNAFALIHILEAVREYVPNCRVYSAGSSEQFGNGNHQFSPRSIYGVSKCTSQLICKVYRESYGLYVVHGILHNHESERRQDYFVTRKITKGVARIKKALGLNIEFQPIELGNLDAKRDWSHASDFMDGIWRMLNQEIYRKDLEDTPMGSILIPGAELKPSYSYLIPKLKEYILSSDESHSIREFCEEAFHAAGIKNVYWFKENGEAKHDCLWTQGMDDMGKTIQDKLVTVNPEFYRPADVEHLCGDSTLARQELGWEPKISFKDLVKRMVIHDYDNE